MAVDPMLIGKIDSALLVSGCAAAVFAVAAIAAEPTGKLEDVQIGERGDTLRIALICSSRCDVAPATGVDFQINGVLAELDLDLSARSALARRLSIAPANGSSVIKLDAAARINEARVIACQSDTGVAPCIEYRFEPAARAAPGVVPAAAQKTQPKPAIRDNDGAQAEARTHEAGEDLPFIGAIILSPGPVLRDEPASGVLYLPQFAPPERLAPPSVSPDSGDQKHSELPANVGVARPSLISVDRAETLGEGASFDIKREATEILGKSFSVGVCEGAKARLQGDAWALDAMINLAYCKAADGKLEEADADFARLLAYTPDNYEALVGRGLIAIASGEREKGLAFYQEALNALPPIAESDRIVEAMRRS